MLGRPRLSELTSGLVTWCLLVRTEQGAHSAARHAPPATAWATLPHHLPVSPPTPDSSVSAGHSGAWAAIRLGRAI